MAIHRSPEWREKQRLAHLGKLSGSKHPMYGRHHTPEAKEKIRLAQLGRKESIDTRKKLSLLRSGKNHPLYGKHHSEETKKKISLSRIGRSFNANEKHGQWRGDMVGYKALHAWLRRNYGIPITCETCGSTVKIQYSNISGEYRRERSDWQLLCQSCHRKYDNMMRRERK